MKKSLIGYITIGSDNEIYPETLKRTRKEAVASTKYWNSLMDSKKKNPKFSVCKIRLTVLEIE